MLEDIVLQVTLPGYNNYYTKKLETYDKEEGLLTFSDGESYYIADDLKENPSDYIDKWAYLLCPDICRKRY